MKTVIYLDELLLVNFFASLCFLMGTALLTGRSAPFWRFVVGGGIAALSSLALLAPELPLFFSLLYRLVSICGIVAATFGRGDIRGLIQECVWYFLLNTILMGMTALRLLSGCPPGLEMNNLIVYYPLSPGLLLLSVGMVYLLLRVVLFVWGTPKEEIARGELVVGERTVSVRLFHDTGFRMEDALTGRGVILVKYTALQEALSPALRGYLAQYFLSSSGTGAGKGEIPLPERGFHIRLIPCQTVLGSQILPAIPAQELRRKERGKQYRQEHLLAVLCSAETAGESWDVLVGTQSAQSLGML